VSKIRLLFQKIFVQFFPKHDSPKGFIFITAGRDLRKTVILRSLPVRQDRGGKSCLAGSFIGVQIPQVETCGYENPAFQAVSSAHGLRVKPAMTDTHEVGFRGSATGRSRKIAGIENSSERAISLAQGKANLAGKALCRKRILSDKPQRGVIRFVSFDYALSGLNDIVHPVRRAVPCAIDPALSELVTYLYHGDGYDAGATIAVATGKQKTETKSVMKTCIV
jgi:hypothetical protein